MYWAWLEGIPYSRNRFEEYISIERGGEEGRKGGREGEETDSMHTKEVQLT